MSGAPAHIAPLDEGVKTDLPHTTSSDGVTAMEDAPDVHTVALSMLILKNTALEGHASTRPHGDSLHSTSALTRTVHADGHPPSEEAAFAYLHSNQDVLQMPVWDDRSSALERPQLHSPTQFNTTSVSFEDMKVQDKARSRSGKRSPVFVFCQVAGCTKAATNVSKGLCTGHFRERVDGAPAHDRQKMSMRAKVGDLFVCTYPECTKGARSKGLCKRHGGGKRCSVFDCPRSDQGGGLCIKHGGGRRCAVEGCKNSSQSRGLCKRHGGFRDGTNALSST